MRVLVWGLGYVGTVSAACLAQLGHEVIGIEPSIEKVHALNSGRSAIREPGLDELVEQMVACRRLRATQEGSSLVSSADVSLICVGTPSAPDGSPILDYVRNVTADIRRGLQDGKNYHVVGLRSTVLPGTTRRELIPLLEQHGSRRAGRDFGLAMNPEFIRETTALSDFHAPPYTVIGQCDSRSGDTIAALYEGINAPVYRVTPEEAELLKIVNNVFHGLKIGFANEVGRLCDRLGVDSHTVMRMVCADTKLNISSAYLRPGFAFGGSCLPKELRSITSHARHLGVQIPIIDAILSSNHIQIEEARLKVHQMGVQRVGVLGLSFKPNTDDLRESPVIELIRDLWQDGISVLVHDPDVHLDRMLGSNRAYLERQLPQIREIMRPDIEDVLNDVEVVIVSQRRPEFSSRLCGLNGHAAVLDLVRLSEDLSSIGVSRYRGMSW